MARALLLFVLACSGSTAEPGPDAGNLVCEPGESEVFCRDLLPESFGGPRCCGDHGVFGCQRDDGAVRCPDGLLPASECERRVADTGVTCR